MIFNELLDFYASPDECLQFHSESLEEIGKLKVYFSHIFIVFIG